LFLSEPLGREFAEFVVDQRQELLCSTWVALLDGRQDTGDIAHDRMSITLEMTVNHPKARTVGASSTSRTVAGLPSHANRSQDRARFATGPRPCRSAWASS